MGKGPFHRASVVKFWATANMAIRTIGIRRKNMGNQKKTLPWILMEFSTCPYFKSNTSKITLILSSQELFLSFPLLGMVSALSNFPVTFHAFLFSHEITYSCCFSHLVLNYFHFCGHPDCLGSHCLSPGPWQPFAMDCPVFRHYLLCTQTVLSEMKIEHIIPLLRNLQWLPINSRSKSKSLVFNYLVL